MIDLMQILCESGGLLPAYQMTPAVAKPFYIREDALKSGIHARIVTRNPWALYLLLHLDEHICRNRYEGFEQILYYYEEKKKN